MWRKTNGTQTGFNTWRMNFGSSAGSGAGEMTMTAVPEPSTAAMLLVGALVAVFLKRGVRLHRRIIAARIRVHLPRLAVFGLIGAVLFPQNVAAEVTSASWINTMGGNWTTAANWDPATVPNNNGADRYEVTIDATGAEYTVSLSSDITIDELLLNSAEATVNHTGGTFGASGAITLSAGTFQLNGGTISSTIIDVAGGTLAITANVNNLLTGVTVNGDLTLNTMNADEYRRGDDVYDRAHDGQFLRPEFRAGSDAHRNDPLRRDRRRHAVRHDEWRREYVHHRPHGRDPHSDRLHRQRADRHEPEPRTDHIPAH